MPVYEIAYCTRSEVKRALDLKQTTRADYQVDRAMESSARQLEGIFARRFYPEDGTRYIDWPNYQYAYPWKVWLHSNELAAWPAVQVLAGTQQIPINEIFPGPWDEWPGPPFTFLELDRSSSAAFGGNSPTPQRSISIQGTFGYDTNKDQMATLSASVSSTSSTTLTVSDSSRLDAGAILIIDSERMRVQDSAMSNTGVTLTSGAASANVSDTTIVTSGALNVQEVILIDSERMLVVDVTSAGSYVVKRGWDGTIPAAHSASTAIWAPRTLTVVRGDLGTTAATHNNAAAVFRHRVPSAIRDLAIAKSEIQLTNEPSAYAAQTTSGDAGKAQKVGDALEYMFCNAIKLYRRNARIRAI